MMRLADVLTKLVDRGDVEVVLPMHRSPIVRESLLGGASDDPWLRLIEPLGYFDFIAAIAAADLVITDSGGVQEEAATFANPYGDGKAAFRIVERLSVDLRHFRGYRQEDIEDHSDHPSAYG